MSVSNTTTPAHRQPRLLSLLAGSCALFVGSFVVDQAIRWTNPLEGIVNAAIHMVLFSLAWLIYGLLPGLMFYGLYRWGSFRRFRSIVIMAPGIIACVFGLVGLIWHPPTAAGRLKQFAHVDLPRSARDLRTHFTGGGISDYADTYYFRCTPADTDKLVEALNLTPGNSDDIQMFERFSPEWPDPTSWQGSKVYRGGRDGAWFYYLLTDPTREHVYLLIGCI